MGITPLLPIAGAALGSLAARIGASVANGPSFRDLLSGHSPAAEASHSDDADDSPKRAELEAELESFVRQVRQRLAAAGVDVSQPVELKSDGGGGVVVGEPHPQRAAIEAVFAEDAQLASTFHFLEALFTAEDVAGGSQDFGFAGDFRLALSGHETRIDFK